MFFFVSGYVNGSEIKEIAVKVQFEPQHLYNSAL